MIENSDMDWAAAVGDEVRAWLARTRHSQAQLALHLGLAKSAITRRVRGEYPFAITELIEIAQWLDISLEQLLGPTILRAQKSPRGDMVTAGAAEDEWALRGSNPRPMDYRFRMPLTDWAVILAWLWLAPSTGHSSSHPSAPSRDRWR